MNKSILLVLDVFLKSKSPTHPRHAILVDMNAVMRIRPGTDVLKQRHGIKHSQLHWLVLTN